MNFTAGNNENITFNVSGTGKVNLPNLRQETLNLVTDSLSTANITKFTGNEGVVDLMVTATGNGTDNSNAKACFKLAKKAGSNSIVNNLCDVAGNAGESLTAQWLDGSPIQILTSADVTLSYTNNNVNLNLNLVFIS